MTRYLDSVKDRELLKEAFEWKNTAPSWFREMFDIWKESFQEYIEAAKNELNYGVFVEGELVAVIRLIEAFPWTFNIHLAAKKGTDLTVLTEAGLELRDFLFANGVYSFYGYIWKKNKGICKLYESLGFHDSGVRCYKGKIRGRIACWIQYICVRSDFIVDKNLIKT